MKKLCTIFFLLISTQLPAQYPSIQKSYTFGGSSFDQAASGLEGANGDFVFVGQTQSSDYDVTRLIGIMDIWLVKLNEKGTIYKSRTYGGYADEWAVKILKSAEGYFILGTTYSNDIFVRGNHGEYDVWALRINDKGDILRSRCLGGSANEYANDGIATSDGGYLIAATSYSSDGDVNNNHGDADIWVVKLDKSGEIEWQKSLGGTGAEQSAKILETEYGNFIIASSGASTDGSLREHHGGNDVWVVELSNTGNILRQQCYGGTGDDNLGSIAAKSGSILGITATSSSNDGDVSGQHGLTDVWFLQLNQKGKLTSQQCFGGTSTDQARDIKSMEEGGWLLAASTYSLDGNVTENYGGYDTWLLELNANGNLVWQHNYGGSKDDIPNGLFLTNENHWSVCGYSHSQTNDVPKNNGESDFWVFQLYKEQTKKPFTFINPQIKTSEY